MKTFPLFWILCILVPATLQAAMLFMKIDSFAEGYWTEETRSFSVLSFMLLSLLVTATLGTATFYVLARKKLL